MSSTQYPIEIAAPDIEPYRKSNSGVDYITTFDSAKPGPHVMISAVVHGNELCGAITLDWLLQNDVRPLRGKLTLAFMNVAAYKNFHPESPTASRFVDEDFNRLWQAQVLASSRDSVELRRAREVRPIVDQVEYLLDIHSMQHHATVPLMMCGALQKGRDLARAINYPQHIVSDEGHAAGKRMRDYQDFADPSSNKNALLIECGQHWQSSSVCVARETTLRFLNHFDIIDPEFSAQHSQTTNTQRSRLIEVVGPVTIKNDHFRFAQDYIGMEVISHAGTVLGWDGEDEICTPHDDCVLIMPSRRLMKGQTAVRLGRFID